jgi:hypothetical protein
MSIVPSDSKSHKPSTSASRKNWARTRYIFLALLKIIKWIVSIARFFDYLRAKVPEWFDWLTL